MRSRDSATPLLTVDKLSWDINGHRILNNINLTIFSKRSVGLIGPNGAGKSSLLRCLYRFNQPTQGAIKYQNQNIWQLSAKEYAKRVAVVLQETPAQFNLTVFDVVALGLTPHKALFSISNQNDRSRIALALKKVDLTNQATQRFDSLSGGEKQRALIARAIVQQPQLLIMDEPTSHLDVKYQIQIMALAKSLGVTVLASFHDLNLASAMCDDLIVLNNGEIQCTGTPNDVLNESMLSNVFGVRTKVSTHPHSSKSHTFPHITYFYGNNAHE
ncbi:ABC transporter ATP-binding protein [Pseudoalteromonas sp. MMG010]|nr:ABC transporter ATP-binding protein [Pseudoalteromonas sp. MMG010]MBQ4832816.1 ABC transporter ATP-binding protein [Pseudoalteromonas sp. MMG010]